LDFAGDRLLVGTGAGEDESAVGIGADGVALRARPIGGEGEGARFAGGEADDDDLVGNRGEDLAGVARAADVVADAHGGVVEREFAAVVGEIFVTGEVQAQVADGLERHAVGFAGAGEDFFAGEFGGARVVAGEDEAADLGKGVAGGGDVVVVRAAGPERVFVELQALFADAAEDHRAEAAVAEREGLDPLAGGLRIPERQRLRRSGGLGGESE
jgi:hypothetical protein